MEAPEAGVLPPLPLTRGRGQDGAELDLPGVQERRREGAEHLSGRSRAPPWRGGDDVMIMMIVMIMMMIGLMMAAPVSGEEEAEPSLRWPGALQGVSRVHHMSYIIIRAPSDEQKYLNGHMR